MKKLALRALLAGFAIGCGGIAYLSADSKALGAFLFSTGLFTILCYGLNLFTGRIGYLSVRPSAAHASELGVTYVLNMLGSGFAGILMLGTRFAPALSEKAAAISAAKIGDSPLSTFILACLCGVMMFLGSDIFKKAEGAGKYLAIIYVVMLFIIAGFEHCVANMFYFTVGGAWSVQAVIHMAVSSLGNAVGAMIFCYTKEKSLL